MDLAFLPLELRWSDVTSSHSIGGNDTRGKTSCKPKKQWLERPKSTSLGVTELWGVRGVRKEEESLLSIPPAMHVLNSPLTAELYEDIEWIYTLRELLSTHQPALQPRQIKCANAYQKGNSIITLYFKIMLPFPLDIIIFYGLWHHTQITNTRHKIISILWSLPALCPPLSQVATLSISVIHSLHFILSSATLSSLSQCPHWTLKVTPSRLADSLHTQPLHKRCLLLCAWLKCDHPRISHRETQPTPILGISGSKLRLAFFSSELLPEFSEFSNFK